MKKILIISIFFLSFFAMHSNANAVDCWPSWDGPWSVEADCTWPSGTFRISGDINVGNSVVTVPDNEVIGINLSVNKVTFDHSIANKGKILFQGSAKMDNSIPYSTSWYILDVLTQSNIRGTLESRYSRASFFTGNTIDSNASTHSNSSDCNVSGICTACPSGTRVLENSNTMVSIGGPHIDLGNVTSGFILCAKVNY